jgi:hypothetical protein
MKTFSGGCLCGGVLYTYEGELGGTLGAVTVCHCASCRRAQGYAVGVVPASADVFVVTAGADLVREYESSPGQKRAFCTLCGSPLYSRRDDKPDALRIRLGSLDRTPESLTVEAHTYAEGAPAWAFADDAPRYPGLEPGRK